MQIKIFKSGGGMMRNGVDALKWDFGDEVKLRFNSLSANPTKWSNTLKQFVGNLPTNCLSVTIL